MPCCSSDCWCSTVLSEESFPWNLNRCEYDAKREGGWFYQTMRSDGNSTSSLRLLFGVRSVLCFLDTGVVCFDLASLSDPSRSTFMPVVCCLSHSVNKDQREEKAQKQETLSLTTQRGRERSLQASRLAESKHFSSFLRAHPAAVLAVSGIACNFALAFEQRKLLSTCTTTCRM